MLRLLLFTSVIMLTSCSKPDPQTLLPMPVTRVQADPTDEQLKSAIARLLAASNAPAASRYSYQRIDLNADGLREGIVFIKSPYGYWCGLHGCALLIFKAHRNGFQLLNSVQPARPPIYVSQLETNGWRNIIVRVSGRNTKAKNVMLKFNGNNYPTDPSNLPPYSVSLATNPSHIRVIHE